MARYKFRRMTPQELSDAMATAGIRPGDLVALGVAADRRVGEWLAGREDIPAWMPAFLTALTAPGALADAKSVAQQYRDEESVD